MMNLTIYFFFSTIGAVLPVNILFIMITKTLLFVITIYFGPFFKATGLVDLFVEH